MLIVTLRTDNPKAEIGLYQDDQRIAYQTWTAHRQLAETIHIRLRNLLNEQGYQIKHLQGLVIFKGPGSFTGLRIGISVANALAYALKIPIIGSADPDWQITGIKMLAQGRNDTVVIPEYGALPNITQQKK